MAGKSYGYMATISADTDGMDEALAQLITNLREVDSQCRGLDGSLRQVGTA